LCLFLDGEFYLERLETCTHLDRMQASGEIPPVDAVFVSHVDGAARHRDFTCNGEYTKFLVEELLPWIGEVHHIPTTDILLAGLSLSGLSAAYAAIEHPQVFSRVLCQSPSAWWNDEWLAARVDALPALPARFWISVGTEEVDEDVHHEPTALHQKSSQLDSCRRLAAAVDEKASATRFATFTGGHDMACWNQELPEAIAWLSGSSE
jgi:enterochelin esterase family protein